jgi:hypothetical protein
LYYCCSEWGYTGVFTKVLTVYQIYHTWVHPFHCFLSSPPSPIPGTISTGIIFCIYLRVYTLFVPYSSSYPFPCLLVSFSVQVFILCFEE